MTPLNLIFHQFFMISYLSHQAQTYSAANGASGSGDAWAKILTEGKRKEEALQREARAQFNAMLSARNKQRIDLIDRFMDLYEQHNVWNQKHFHSALYIKTLLENPELLSKIQPNMPRKSVESTLRSLYRLLTTQLSDLTPREAFITYDKTKFYYRNIDEYPLDELRGQFEELLINTLAILIQVRGEKIEPPENPEQEFIDMEIPADGYIKLLFMIDQLPKLHNGVNYDQLYTFHEGLSYETYADIVFFMARNL